MGNDGKPSENEPEDVALSLETYEMSIINQWVAPKNTNKPQMYFHYWF